MRARGRGLGEKTSQARANGYQMSRLQAWSQRPRELLPERRDTGISGDSCVMPRRLFGSKFSRAPGAGRVYLQCGRRSTPRGCEPTPSLMRRQWDRRIRRAVRRFLLVRRYSVLLRCAASRAVDKAYRRSVEADASPQGSGPDASAERLRQAARGAFERRRGIRLLLPAAFVPTSMRDRADRLRDQLVLAGTAIANSSAAAIGNIVATVAMAAAASIPAFVASELPLLPPGPVSVASTTYTFGSPPEASPGGVGEGRSVDASLSTDPIPNGPAHFKTKTAIERQIRIMVVQETHARVGNGDLDIDGVGVWVACDTEVRAKICDAYDSAASHPSGAP